jgi:hypothetical protein
MWWLGDCTTLDNMSALLVEKFLEVLIKQGKSEGKNE